MSEELIEVLRNLEKLREREKDTVGLTVARRPVPCHLSAIIDSLGKEEEKRRAWSAGEDKSS